MAGLSWAISYITSKDIADIVILLAIILHIGEGITFAVTNAASGSIGMAALLSVFRFRSCAAVILIIFSMMAGFGHWRAGLRPPARFLLLMPQQTLFLITAFGAILDVMMSHYADGVQRPWIFILWDQAPRILAPAIYACAICNRVQRYENISVLERNIP